MAGQSPSRRRGSAALSGGSSASPLRRLRAAGLASRGRRRSPESPVRHADNQVAAFAPAAGGGGACTSPPSTLQQCNTSTEGKTDTDSGNGSPRMSPAGRPLRSSRFRRYPSWTAAAIRGAAALSSSPWSAWAIWRRLGLQMSVGEKRLHRRDGLPNDRCHGSHRYPRQSRQARACARWRSPPAWRGSALPRWALPRVAWCRIACARISARSCPKNRRLSRTATGGICSASAEAYGMTTRCQA